MSAFWWFIAGWLAAHLGWGLLFVLMWWKLVHKLPPDERRTAIQEDYLDVRRSILARRGWRN